MSFGVSYSKDHHIVHDKWFQSSQSTPFEDWKARGSILDAVFQYAAHWEETMDVRVYFMPGYKFGYIKLYAEFVVMNFELWFEMSFDEEHQIVHVERLFCKRENYWSNDAHGLQSGTGGIGFYKKNLEDLGDDIEINIFVRHFFGPGWKVAPLPMTRPMMREGYLKLVEVANGHYDHYHYGPWFKVVGIYPMEREEAATTIQKIYRGWRVRIKYTFNPNTSLGKFLIMREFRKAINE